jgi:hypothetical protein
MNPWTNLGERKLRTISLNFSDLLADYDTDGDLKLDQSEIPDSAMVTYRPESHEFEESSMRLNSDESFGWADSNKDMALDSIEWEKVNNWLKNYVGEHGMLAIPAAGSGERPGNDLLWKVMDDTPEVPSPLVVGEHIFFIKNGGIITVIDRETGEVVKNGRVAAPGTYFASPMLAGNRIYTCSYNGTVSVLSAEDFSVLATNKLKERIGASPVAVDDVLYVRTDKHLYAFREQ